MASSQFSLLLLASTALLVLTTVESVRPNIPTVLCDKAAYPEVCNSVMRNVFGRKRAALKANIEATKLNTDQAWEEAKHLVPSASDSLKSCLDAANQQYENVVLSLDDALKAMDAKDPDTLNSVLASAETSFGDIDTCFDEIGETNPLGKPNAFLKELAANNLYLYDRIKF